MYNFQFTFFFLCRWCNKSSEYYKSQAPAITSLLSGLEAYLGKLIMYYYCMQHMQRMQARASAHPRKLKDVIQMIRVENKYLQITKVNSIVYILLSYRLQKLNFKQCNTCYAPTLLLQRYKLI